MTNFPYAAYDSWKTTVPVDETPLDYGKCPECGKETELCDLCGLCGGCCTTEFDNHDLYDN